ncbi:MAG: phosphoribosylglycinamide formyltransferase [Verrucomicrobiae bacterium]|nr:phosphoribosylglycinamide formyltransferase [Verrucomicrobiae bacterium]
MKRIGVLGSGKGSNFGAIAKAAAAGNLPVEIGIVLADVENAGILGLAQQHGIPNRFVPPGKYRTKLDPAAEQEYIRLLREARVDMVVLAGFMRMLKQPFIEAFAGRIINIHPSLLPAFPGLESWKQALDYGARYAGCTVHFVTLEMDAGPIILQAAVPIQSGDTAATLHERIQKEEHRIYVEALRLWAEDRLRIEGRRVIIRNT